MNEQPRVESVEEFKLRIAATYVRSLSTSLVHRDRTRCWSGLRSGRSPEKHSVVEAAPATVDYDLCGFIACVAFNESGLPSGGG